MVAVDAGLMAELATGAAHVCRCWRIDRRDGTILGFTDHDVDLAFDGVEFRAATGLTGSALESTTSMRTENAAVQGILRAGTLEEGDIIAGRFDGALVRQWLVNWQDVTARAEVFAGTIGEVRRAGSAFEAEVRGLAEGLSRPFGRVFHRRCDAVLGDARCGFDLTSPGFTTQVPVLAYDGGADFDFGMLPGFAAGWFVHGVMDFLDGAAEGISISVKLDHSEGGKRLIRAWESPRAAVSVGDNVRLTAGCDKSTATCRLKFTNFENFRGFPHLPDTAWILNAGATGVPADGGSLNT